MLSTSFTWWDKSKPGSAPTSPAVVTRLIPVAVPKASITPMQAPEPPQKSLKRKRAEQERRQKKKSRASSTESSTPPPIPSAAPSRKRVSKASGARPSPTPSTSRASAGARPNPSTSEAIYRHSRSRSASVLRASDEPIPRDCYLEADAGRDEDLLTCEKVFREYQKSYKTPGVFSVLCGANVCATTRYTYSVPPFTSFRSI
ncbi:hypothetical protein OF83DRAFT_137698 [Amylostereum chailletii]|nr:hypothetical protein OF83DRAFT_137698 [Amylostereum chailletii]